MALRQALSESAKNPTDERATDQARYKGPNGQNKNRMRGTGMKKKAWDENTKKLIARINAIVITEEEIVEVVEETEEINPEDRNWEASTFMVARLHPGDFEKVGAIVFRMEALTRLLAKAGAPGWTLPETADGGILTQEAVFAATAVQPLVEQDGEVAFEQEAFLQKVLELADLEEQA